MLHKVAQHFPEAAYGYGYCLQHGLGGVLHVHRAKAWYQQVGFFVVDIQPVAWLT